MTRRATFLALMASPFAFVKGLWAKPQPPSAITLMRQLMVVRDRLIPFWGNGKTEMTLHPDTEGNVEVVYVFRDGKTSHISGFLATKEMTVLDRNGGNPLLRHVADHFREWMLSMSYDVRMNSGPTQYPTEAELAALEGHHA